jgi:hypothetical protein
MFFYTKYCFKCEKSFPNEIDNICYLYSQGKWTNRFVCLECLIKKEKPICSICKKSNNF